MPKVSVIIPIYNVEEYLPKCLDSVCNQTLKDIEIICVNDCSPDNSLAILEDYAQKDDRIKIVNREKNGGLSAARNSGLAVAQGEYVYFLDSDDWIDLDYVEKMYNVITEKKLNAVCNTNIIKVDEEGKEEKLLKRGFMKDFKPYTSACQMAWSWILRKDFLDKFKVVFPEGLKYEDTYFFHVLIRSIGDVYIINSSSYYHFENPNSIMGKAENRLIKDYDSIEVICLIYEYYKQNNLLEKWNIPFFYLHKYMLNKHTNKEIFFEKLQSLYNIMKSDINDNKNLYSQLEFDFYKDILNNKNYLSYQKLDISIINSLRKNMLKGKIDNGI